MARDGSPLLAAATQEKLPCTALRVPFARFDIIHAHDARSHTLGAIFARVPLVVSRRVAFPVRKGFFSTWKYRRPALFLAVSNFVSRQLQAAGVAESRISVVYDGVSVPPEPSRGTEILIPETADPEKGMALAEEAARIAGVTVRKSSNLTADLPKARAMLYITHSEGLGSGILLAMAHGVPVVASNVGGIPEVVQNEVNGLLVQNEPNCIAAALRRITPAMGSAARATVIERFSGERMVAATIAAYERVLARA
jgi:glycosyltransferase involved in cell wall biosynthesis